MSEDIHHECGVAALCLLKDPRGGKQTMNDVAGLMPRMLLDLQNRGQLAAGFSTYNANRPQLIDTFKDLGTVDEVFRMSRLEKHEAILSEYAGTAAIGHTRYATCGADDARYAQPFERHHGRLWKWFSFAFNGTLSNYVELRDRLLSKRQYHFSLNTDTEIIMHSMSYRLRGDKSPTLRRVMSTLARDFDGAYNIVFLDATGRMFVARDPLGLRPMSWAVKDGLFAAASESVALANIGFTDVKTLNPGQMAIIENGTLRFEQFAESKRKAHCFFEWVYFSNVASEIDGHGVYLSRAAAGTQLALIEKEPADDNSVVVPVPDTAKAAADSFAYQMKIPCLEGLIRNRYVGRTFIQPDSTRGRNAKNKYTPLASVLAGKRVFLIEDSIVRSTTLRSLVDKIRNPGGAKEVHVRVACPPIIAPCFYGIDMSTLGELFATQHLGSRYKVPTAQALKKMANALDLDSLQYLPVSQLPSCIGCDKDSLCLGCVTGKYPSPWGGKLIRRARQNYKKGLSGRTYE